MTYKQDIARDIKSPPTNLFVNVGAGEMTIFKITATVRKFFKEQPVESSILKLELALDTIIPNICVMLYPNPINKTLEQ